MSIELTLREFFRNISPTTLTLVHSAPLYRGLSLPPTKTVRANNAETAWFCCSEDDAIGYANFKVAADARPYLIAVRTAYNLELVGIELNKLSELPFGRKDGPGHGSVPLWQKEKLLPALLKLFPVDGFYEGTPPCEFWLTEQTYDIVDVEAL